MFIVLCEVIIILQYHYNDEGDSVNGRTTFEWRRYKKEKDVTHF
jgi:hypothetical protein